MTGAPTDAITAGPVTVRVAVVQAAPALFDARRSLQKLADLTADAARRGDWQDHSFRITAGIVLGTLPIAIAGLALKRTLEGCGSPLRNIAVIGWLPTARPDVVNDAVPPLSVPVPIVVAPSEKVTAPVGVPAPGAPAP